MAELAPGSALLTTVPDCPLQHGSRITEMYLPLAVLEDCTREKRKVVLKIKASQEAQALKGNAAEWLRRWEQKMEWVLLRNL